MAESNDYECKISKSWALIDINLNEKSPVLLESQADWSPSSFLLQENGQSEIVFKDSKNEKLLESTKDIKIICSHGFDCNKHSHILVATDENQDKSIINGSDNISDDSHSSSSDSIEVLDFDNSFRDSNDSISTLNHNTDENETNNLNCIKLDKNKSSDVCDNDDRTNLVEGKKKLLNIFFQSHDTNSSDKYDSFEGNRQSDTRDLRTAVHKSKSLTPQKNCLLINKNIAFGIFFAGILCFIISHILEVHESLFSANKTGQLMESLDLTLHLKQLDAGFDINKVNVNQDFYELVNKIWFKKSTTVTHNNAIPTIRNISQKPFNFIFLKNPSKNESNKIKETRDDYQKRCIANFIKILKYIFHNFNSFNINYKDLKAKCFDKWTPVILKILEPLLICLTSQNNTSKNYQKLNEIISKDKCNINSFGDEVIINSPLFIDQTNTTKLKSSCTKNKTTSSDLTYSFPQPKAYYAKEKNYYGKVSVETYLPKVRKDNKYKKLKSSFQKNVSQKNMKIKNNVKRRGEEKNHVRASRKKKKMKFNKNDKQHYLKENSNELFNRMKSKINSRVKKKIMNKFEKIGRTNLSKRCNHILNDAYKNQGNYYLEKPMEKHDSITRNVPFKVVDSRKKPNADWQFERAESRKQYRNEYSSFNQIGRKNLKSASDQNRNNGFENWQFERAEARKHLRQNFS